MPTFKDMNVASTAWEPADMTDITGILTLQNKGAFAAEFTATASGVMPPLDNPSLSLVPNEKLAAWTLAELFPGVPGATRLWVKAVSGTTEVHVSHA